MNDGYIQIGVIGMRDPATGKFLDESVPIYIKGEADPAIEARAEKLISDMIMKRLYTEDGRIDPEKVKEALT